MTLELWETEPAALPSHVKSPSRGHGNGLFWLSASVFTWRGGTRPFCFRLLNLTGVLPRAPWGTLCNMPNSKSYLIISSLNAVSIFSLPLETLLPILGMGWEQKQQKGKRKERNHKQKERHFYIKVPDMLGHQNQSFVYLSSLKSISLFIFSGLLPHRGKGGAQRGPASQKGGPKSLTARKPKERVHIKVER